MAEQEQTELRELKSRTLALTLCVTTLMIALTPESISRARMALQALKDNLLLRDTFPPNLDFAIFNQVIDHVLEKLTSDT